jgi:hypothetical protein
MTTHVDSIERYYAIRQARFGFVERIELLQSIDTNNLNGVKLEIDLCSNADLLSTRLKLIFSGVQHCRIGPLSGLLRYMIEIAWIGDSRMEGVNYKISESEYDAFSFICESFSTDVI